MTGLTFTSGFMNLLTSFPILSEGGGHKHCNLIIKLLALALSMGLLVAHWGRIAVCLKVIAKIAMNIAKICLLWINIWVNFGSYFTSGFVCSLLRKFLWNIWEELHSYSKRRSIQWNRNTYKLHSHSCSLSQRLEAVPIMANNSWANLSLEHSVFLCTPT